MKGYPLLLVVLSAAAITSASCGGQSSSQASSAPTTVATPTTLDAAQAAKSAQLGLNLACRNYGQALQRQRDNTITGGEWDQFMQGDTGAEGWAALAARTDSGYTQFAQYMADIARQQPSADLVAQYQQVINNYEASINMPASAWTGVDARTQAWNYETQKVQQVCKNEAFQPSGP